MSLTSFPVTDLGPEVKLMHLLRMRRDITVMFETDSKLDRQRVRVNFILFKNITYQVFP